LAKKKCKREDGFLYILNAEVRIRNRENTSSSSLRKPDMIPPAEISIAILKLIEIHHGATASEIPTAVARMLGFRNTSAQLRKQIVNTLGRLIRLGKIQEQDGMICLIEV
jgi:hypothetical protein